MCINAPNVKVSIRNRYVYKVVVRTTNGPPYRYYFPFRAADGGDMPNLPVGFAIDKKPLTLHNPAVAFHTGYGYSCFNKLTAAKFYLSCIHKRYYNTGYTCVVLKLKLPLGTRYATGRIRKAYYGPHLPAIRVERLEMPTDIQATEVYVHATN